MRDLGRVELTPKSVPPPSDPGRLVLVPPSSPPPPPDPVIEPAGGGAYVYRDSAFSARIEYDGTVKFEDEGLGPLGLQHRGLGASFDFTDAIIRGQGDDPYRFEKARMLDRTREFRADLAEAACEERLRESIFALRGRLVKIWSNGAMPVEQRRALLFAVWDECAEEGDAELLRHAEMARATVLGFIQSNLPEGTVNAYSVAELRALDARRTSRQRFEPYASVEEPPG